MLFWQYSPSIRTITVLMKLFACENNIGNSPFVFHFCPVMHSIVERWNLFWITSASKPQKNIKVYLNFTYINFWAVLE